MLFSLTSRSCRGPIDSLYCGLTNTISAKLWYSRYILSYSYSCLQLESTRDLNCELSFKVRAPKIRSPSQHPTKYEIQSQSTHRFMSYKRTRRTWGLADLDFWPPKWNQLMLESVGRFVPDLRRLPQGVSESVCENSAGKCESVWMYGWMGGWRTWKHNASVQLCCWHGGMWLACRHAGPQTRGRPSWP